MTLKLIDSTMADHIQKTIATYDVIAPNYNLTAAPDLRAWEEDSMRMFLSYLKGKVVLVPGCGDGRDSRFLTSMGLQVHSLDLSESMLKLAKEKDPSGVYQKLDFRNLASLDVIFDGVFASGCLYHLKKVEFSRVIKDIWSLLLPQGIFYLNMKLGNGEGFRSKPGPDYPGGDEARKVLQGERFYAYYTNEELLEYFNDFKLLNTRKLEHAEKVREYWLQKLNES